MVASSISYHTTWLSPPILIVVGVIVVIVLLSLCAICFNDEKGNNKSDKGRKSGVVMLDYNSRKHNHYDVSTSLSSEPLLYSVTSIEEETLQPSIHDLHPYGLLQSTYPEIPDPPENIHKSNDLGNIYFTIKYLPDDQILTVTIEKATSLPAKDLNGKSDPYVTLVLLPDKAQKLATRVRKRNLNPVWKEELCFEGFPYQKLQQRTLYMKVYDHDALSRDDEIGEVRLPLSEVPLLPEPVPFVKKLEACKNHQCEFRGSLLVSLCYLPTCGCMEVIVM